MNKPTRGAIAIVVTIAIVVAGIWAANAIRRGHESVFGGDAFGTRYTIRLRRAHPYPTHAGDIPNSVNNLIETCDFAFSGWRGDSAVSQINADYRGLKGVPPELADLVIESKSISELTGGAFDITVAPLVDLWGFGPGGRAANTPTQEAINTARALVGSDRIRVHTESSSIGKDDPKMRIDVSGIAKGATVDHIHAQLGRFHPLNGWMIEVGGEIRVKGTWKIGIEAPTPDARSILHKIELTDAALATSGDYRNFIEADGKRLSHIIDPRTGRPVEHNLASVSVIADTCARADALATAMMVMGPAEARAFAERHGVKAMLILRDSDGFATIRLGGFPE